MKYLAPAHRATARLSRFLRTLAIIALICTVACAVLILVEASLPGGKSAEHSGKIANKFISLFYKNPQSQTATTLDGEHTFTIIGENELFDADGITSNAPSIDTRANVANETQTEEPNRKNVELIVRKVIGHFLLFAILGFGIAGTSFLYYKPRWISMVIGVVLGFAIAVLSEVLQLPAFNVGRGASWNDVLIDMLGVICGIAVAAFMVFSYALLTYLISKDDYRDLRRVFKHIHVRTIFAKSATTMLVFDDCYVRSV